MPPHDGETPSKRAKREGALATLVGADGLANLGALRVLVIGAGGLGCEIVKNLVGSGFRRIDIIDMDTIELTNLNRQFLFWESDIGKPKATVAASKAQAAAAPGVTVTPHVARIEAMPDSFYEQFHIVVCGLDSVRARRWINAKLVDLCFADPLPSGLRPLIDGGSEGLRGQARVILPGITACYECTLGLLLSGEAARHALCTIAAVPRLPEHCIEWSRLVRWPQVFGRDREPDFDAEADMQWLYSESLRRAAEFDIPGVTLERTYGVLKRIVPAVASTNAVIAASCCIEALKLATALAPPLDNYFMYAGDSGVFSEKFALERRKDCPVCGSEAAAITVNATATTVQEFINMVVARLHMDPNVSPSVTAADGRSIYMARPTSLEAQTRSNLSRLLSEFAEAGDDVAVTHPDLAGSVRIKLHHTHSKSSE